MKKLNIVMGFVFMAIATFTYTCANVFKGRVQSDNFGPSLWPKFLSILLGIFSCCLIIQNLMKGKGSKSNDDINISKESIKRLLLLCFDIGVFLVIVKFLGMYIGFLFFVPIIMFLLGERKRIPLISVTIGASLFIYLVFELGLKVPLPKGSLFL